MEIGSSYKNPLSFSQPGCTVTLYKAGADQYHKVSYPSRTGIYHEIDTDTFQLHFNLNDEIIRARAKTPDWPHPHEWLKRTIGNDWIYYSTGGYTGVFETTGEYYLPNLPYPTNNYLGGTPFTNRVVSDLINHWHDYLHKLSREIVSPPDQVVKFINSALSKSDSYLQEKAEKLASVTNGKISVLPPDTRHVDYNVIPLKVSEGCLYKCGFCRVKNDKIFRVISESRRNTDIDQITSIFDRDLVNYNSFFLGEHDALMSGPRVILETIQLLIDKLVFRSSFFSNNCLFLFGSVPSLLETPVDFFRELDSLPFQSYINIGLESADQETLKKIGKPLLVRDIVAAFDRCQEINAKCSSVEMTVNFILDDTLSKNHYDSMLDLVRGRLANPRAKGSVYLSPLSFDGPARSKLFHFYKLKTMSRLPMFLYTIQRL